MLALFAFSTQPSLWGPRLCRHHRAVVGFYGDVLAPVHGVAEIPEGFEINNATPAHGFTVARACDNLQEWKACLQDSLKQAGDSPRLT